MKPGAAALCPGWVTHRRSSPVGHGFRQRVSMVWIDPDDPGELFDRHWLASWRRPAPLRFRPEDHGTDHAPVGSAAVRAELSSATGGPVDGPVRLLTQPRRWGWLFNPLSVYVAWSAGGADPVGVVLEVTNTPWKERHRYAVPLSVDNGTGAGEYRGHAGFAKALHVSPFLQDECDYVLRLTADDRQLRMELDVADPSGAVLLETSLVVDRVPVTRHAVRRFAVTEPLATYAVSQGIHLNAFRLWRKGVPVGPHRAQTSHRIREGTS